MIRRPTRTTRTYTLLPYTALVRSRLGADGRQFRANLRWREFRTGRHRLRLDQLSAGRARLARASGVDRRIARTRLGQLRAARSDRRAALGAWQHRGEIGRAHV